MASALDDLLADFGSNAGTMPPVNPPEASTVLETQTQPEVAGEPEPPVVEDAPPAPTEKPAEVKAAEAAKARKPRGSKKAQPAPAAPPDGWNNVPAAAASSAASDAAGETLDLTAAIRLVARLTPKGSTVTIPGEA
jgi:hypothetical protein